jgi:hypothetical protein
MKKLLFFMLFAMVAGSIACFGQETKIVTVNAGHPYTIPSPQGTHPFTIVSADGNQKVQFFFEKAKNKSGSKKVIFTDWIFYQKDTSGYFQEAPLLNATVSIRGDGGVVKAHDIFVKNEIAGYIADRIDISKTNRLTFSVTYEKDAFPTLTQDFSLKIANKDIQDFIPYPHSTNALVAVASIKQ